jgi:hypothetical protein
MHVLHGRVGFRICYVGGWFADKGPCPQAPLNSFWGSRLRSLKCFGTAGCWGGDSVRLLRKDGGLPLAATQAHCDAVLGVLPRAACLCSAGHACPCLAPGGACESCEQVQQCVAYDLAELLSDWGGREGLGRTILSGLRGALLGLRWLQCTLTFG